MQMTINELLKAVSNNYPVDQAILLRGPTGVGKSSISRAIAVMEKKKFIDVRLGQMTEGDLLGLYSITNGATINHPQKWFLDACEQPCVLAFEELNRGLPSVIQGVFQIILDRRLGEYELHPDTRVLASINTGNQYQVFDLDPALRNRFATVDLIPTKEEFFAWGKGTGSIHNKVLDFLIAHPANLECDVPVEQDKVFPTRRGWEKVSRSLSNDLTKRDFSMVYMVASSLVGMEAARYLEAYLKEKGSKVIYTDIIDDFNLEMMKEMTLTDVSEASDNIVRAFTASPPSQKQIDNFVAFFCAMPQEQGVATWRNLANNKVVLPFVREHQTLLDHLGKIF
jgi:hypothetical protein